MTPATFGSLYGALFAPRRERVAAELLRVCRHGGIVATGADGDAPALRRPPLIRP